MSNELERKLSYAEFMARLHEAKKSDNEDDEECVTNGKKTKGNIVMHDGDEDGRRVTEELNEAWMSQRSSYDGPGKGKLLGDMSEKEHVDAINYHGNQIHQLKTGTHKYSKTYSKQQVADQIANHTKRYYDHKDAYDAHTMKEEVELDEAIKLGSKVTIHDPGQSHHGKTGYVGEIRHGAYKGAPKTYTVDYDHNEETGHAKSIQLDKKNVKLHKEEVELDEANFASTMKKAIAAHERGDHERAKYHLDNAKTARYAMKSTEISKHKDLLDKYKELRDMHEDVDLDEQDQKIQASDVKTALKNVKQASSHTKKMIKANPTQKMPHGLSRHAAYSEELELDEGQKVKTSTGYVHKGSYGSDFDTDEEGAEKKKSAPEVKRGRGRPKKGSDETGEVKKYTFHDLLNRLSR